MRRAVLKVSAQILVDLAKEGNPLQFPPGVGVTEKALPADARAVGGTYNSLLDVFLIAVESDAFDEVAEGQPLPDVPVFTFEVS